MDRLIAGYRLFRETYYSRRRRMFNKLAEGQAPKAMVISCCDSRVDPALILSAEPGEIFTLRNIASLVPPYSPDDAYHGTSAAIEFAVRSLGVQHIIVMAHQHCGGVASLFEEHSGEFIGPWMRIAEPAYHKVKAESGHLPHDQQLQCCEREALKISIANLHGFPWVQALVEAGKLALHGWYFAIEDGALHRLDEETGDFSAL